MLFLLHNMGKQLAARLNMKSERGATMVEYGLMAAFIALVVGAAALTLGGGISDLFGKADKAVDSAPSSTFSTTSTTAAP